MTTATVERRKLKPGELALEWGVDVEAILRLIHNGELRAVDVATSRGRPRWLIDRSDVESFERRRENSKPPKITRKRTREKPGYYPE